MGEENKNIISKGFLEDEIKSIKRLLEVIRIMASVSMSDSDKYLIYTPRDEDLILLIKKTIIEFNEQKLEKLQKELNNL